MFFPFWLWLILLILLSPIIIGLALMGLQKKVRLIHPQTGLAKTGYVGWSWTYFLFGWLVPVIRGEIGIGVLHCILTFATFGIFQWIMSMLYNRQYMTRQLLAGWQLDPADPNTNIARHKLGMAS